VAVVRGTHKNRSSRERDGSTNARDRGNESKAHSQEWLCHAEKSVITRIV
jgi:hypothetical protein